MATRVIVDEDDNVLREVERVDFNPAKDIYRVSALWLTNSNGQALIAQRQLGKRNDPGKWGPAAAGTVEAGETYDENIVHEVEEELGLKDIELIPGPKVFVAGQYKFFCQWYGAVTDILAKDFVVQEEEVRQVVWIDLKTLNVELQKTPEKYISSMSDVPKEYLKVGQL